MADPAELALAFHAAINARDLNGLNALMADNHCFADSGGNCVEGREACLSAWRGFFGAFPDYLNKVDRLQVHGSRVAMAGTSSCSDERLNGPALWLATISDGMLREWRVLEDTQEARRELNL